MAVSTPLAMAQLRPTSKQATSKRQASTQIGGTLDSLEIDIVLKNIRAIFQHVDELHLELPKLLLARCSCCCAHNNVIICEHNHATTHHHDQCALLTGFHIGHLHAFKDGIAVDLVGVRHKARSQRYNIINVLPLALQQQPSPNSLASRALARTLALKAALATFATHLNVNERQHCQAGELHTLLYLEWRRRENQRQRRQCRRRGQQRRRASTGSQRREQSTAESAVATTLEVVTSQRSNPTQHTTRM